MDVIGSKYFIMKVKFICLIFFCGIIFFSCKKDIDTAINVKVHYKNGKPTNISFPAKGNIKDYKVYLEGELTTAMLGNFVLKHDSIVFEPVVPFSYELEYQLCYNNKIVDIFVINRLEDTVKPELSNIFPSTDTLPENLLKMYLVFSKPMQQVENMMTYINVKNIATGNQESIFLKLENELWNKEHTMVTLWLDPGRIKTDLIPNKTLGLPIKYGNSYELVISDALRDADGNRLKNSVKKRFYVSKRDNNKPLVENWELVQIPKSDTSDALVIDFNESLDAILAKETVQIKYNDVIVEGDYMLEQNERILKFTPKNLWGSGSYKILVDTKLEDLAGNNLTKLFDTDVKSDDNTNKILINNYITFNI